MPPHSVRAAAVVVLCLAVGGANGDCAPDDATCSVGFAGSVEPGYVLLQGASRSVPLSGAALEEDEQAGHGENSTALFQGASRSASLLGPTLEEDVKVDRGENITVLQTRRALQMRPAEVAEPARRARTEARQLQLGTRGAANAEMAADEEGARPRDVQPARLVQLAKSAQGAELATKPSRGLQTVKGREGEDKQVARKRGLLALEDEEDDEVALPREAETPRLLQAAKHAEDTELATKPSRWLQTIQGREGEDEEVARKRRLRALEDEEDEEVTRPREAEAPRFVQLAKNTQGAELATKPSRGLQTVKGSEGVDEEVTRKRRLHALEDEDEEVTRPRETNPPRLMQVISTEGKSEAEPPRPVQLAKNTQGAALAVKPSRGLQTFKVTEGEAETPRLMQAVQGARCPTCGGGTANTTNATAVARRLSSGIQTAEVLREEEAQKEDKEEVHAEKDEAKEKEGGKEEGGLTNDTELARPAETEAPQLAQGNRSNFSVTLNSQ